MPWYSNIPNWFRAPEKPPTLTRPTSEWEALKQQVAKLTRDRDEWRRLAEQRGRRLP